MNSMRYTIEFARRDRSPAYRRDEPAGHRSFDMKTISSNSLFEGGKEIGIEHGGALYRLKITRQGKLILNK